MKRINQVSGVSSIFLLMFMPWTTPVHAAIHKMTVATALNELQSTEAGIKKLNSAQSQYIKQNEPYKKNADKILDNYNKQLSVLKQRIADYHAQHQAEIKQIAEEYSNLCDPKRVGKLERAAYDRCNSLKKSDEARMQDIIKEYKSWTKQQDDEFNNTVRAKTNSNLAPLNKHRNRFAELFNKAREKLMSLLSRDKELRGFLVAHPKQVATECHNSGKATRKWCSNIRWDSAGMHLQPMPAPTYSSDVQF